MSKTIPYSIEVLIDKLQSQVVRQFHNRDEAEPAFEIAKWKANMRVGFRLALEQGLDGKSPTYVRDLTADKWAMSQIKLITWENAIFTKLLGALAEDAGFKTLAGLKVNRFQAKDEVPDKLVEQWKYVKWVSSITRS